MSAIKYEEELKRVFISHEKSTSVFLDHTNWLWVGLYSILFLLDLFFFKALDATIINMILLASYVLLFVAVHIWVKSVDFTGRWVKYVLMAPILLSSIGMTIFSEAMFDVAYVALLMISSAYYNRRVVLNISLLGIFSYALAKCLYLLIDFDHLATEYEENFSEDTLWVSFPFFLLYVIFSVFSVLKAMSGRKEIENYVREYCENISDFYDYYRKDERYVFFNIADVSGKGLPASMFAVNTSSYMRASSKADVNIYEVCNTTNKSLCERNPEKMFVTTFMGFLNLETGMVDYINAGHNPAFIIKADGSVQRLISQRNFVLARKPKFNFKTDYLQMQPGDCLFLYTDGITEAFNSNGEMFGEDRLEEALRSGAKLTASDLIEHVKKEVSSFTSGAEQSDDMTMLLLKYNSNRRSYQTQTASFDIDRSSYDSIMDFVKGLPQEAGWAKRFIDDVCICTDEVFANLDMHAFTEEQKERKLTITATLWDNRYKLVFADNGTPFNPLAVDSSQAVAGVKKHVKGGLGIFVIKKIADYLSYKFDNKNNILTLEIWK